MDFDTSPCVLSDENVVLSKTETVMRLRTIAESVRLCPPLVSSQLMASDDLRWSRVWLEHNVDWLGHYADELDCPQQQHLVKRHAGRWGFTYNTVAMIRFVMVSRLVTDNTNIRKMLHS